MKVFLLAPREDWICDRFVAEWYEHNSTISVKQPYDADIVWLLADWAWDQLPYSLLSKKRVITSVHHIVPEKFDQRELNVFRARDAITDLYHVPCLRTEKQVKDILVSIGSTKQVICRPFWVNDKIWKVRETELDLREQYALGGKDSFLIGSFQRDTEGHDLISPKLEKGPDLFCNMIEELKKEKPLTRVVLAGWRRQYVINRLKVAGVSHHYIERPSLETIRDLYKMLNAYVVAARYEGGPQSIVECAALCVPIVSTDVGYAPEFLDSRAIYDANDYESFRHALTFAQSPEAMATAFANVSSHFLEPSFAWYRSFLEMLHKGWNL